MVIVWDELKKYDMTTVSKNLGRKTSVEHEYISLPKEIKSQCISNIKKQLEKCLILLRENEYPYDVDDNVKHYVLWMLENKDLESSKNYVSELLNKVKSDIVMFTNDTSAKSVLEINHHHVFVRMT
jgi:hypothetical protein